MARGRVRLRLWGLPAVPSLSLICGLALLFLAFLSFICDRFLDVGDFHIRPTPERNVDSKGISSIPQFREVQNLHDVPGRGDSSLKNVWASENAGFFYGCSAASNMYAPVSSLGFNGYITVQASGGLNQQRTGIIDSVVVARILNATLVIPELDHASFWHDTSNFSDIFDVDHFIAVIAPDVRVIKELPLVVAKKRSFHRMRVPRKVPASYYKSNVLPKLLSKQALKLTKFDYRLSNRLDDDYQKLRCRVNYKAMRFTKPIQRIGQVLLDRMRRNGGRYIALHLRFEPDMLAFSGCYYGGGQKELEELAAIRRRWKNLPAFDPEKARRNGKCPLTPTEVGLLLRATGFGEDTFLYVASGEVYGGDEALAPLKRLFPNFFTKESLTMDAELRPFRDFSSQMAAIDYIVCDESDIFVANNNGNMARILAGHRRFSGHKRTIRPNLKKLSPLFSKREELGWEQFAQSLRRHQKGFMGDPKEGNSGGEFFENPSTCICERADHSMERRVSEESQSRPNGGRMKWSEIEDDFDGDVDGVGIGSEDVVRTEFVGEELLDAGKENAKLEARLEEVEAEAEENPFLSD